MQIFIDLESHLDFLGWSSCAAFDLLQIRVRHALTSAADKAQSLTSMRQVLCESVHHCVSTLAGAGPHDQCRALQPERSSLHRTH